MLGALLVQAAWALVVPPFRGLDEHDHAYKAAATARGDWAPHHARSSGGWGELVSVPADLVAAANPICASLPYTTPDNCSPVERLGGGRVSVASSASRYNPVFYFVIGSAARPFEGAHALYAMRLTAALLCALLIGLAGVVTRRWSRTRWPLVALLLAATPVLLYSSAIAAPNGVEMASAMVVWSSLLGLARSRGPSPDTRLFVAAATIGALPLTTVRSLGPLWLLLIAATAMCLFRRRDLVRLVRRKDTVAAAVLVALATAAAVGWTLVASTNAAGGESVPGSVWKLIPKSWILWVLQSIAAFPARDESSPVALYALVLVAWWALVGVCLRGATRRHVVVLALVVAVASAVPIAATVLTYDQLGTAWQGRYGYPYAMGFLLVCGFSIDQRAPGSPRAERWLLPATGVVVVVAQLIGQLDVLFQQRRVSPLAGSTEWPAPATALVVALTGLGVALLTLALANRGPGPAASKVRP